MTDRSPWDILSGKRTVSYAEAAEALSLTTRRSVERLVKGRSIDAVGAGHSKRITVDSIVRYGRFALLDTNMRQEATNRDKKRQQDHGHRPTLASELNYGDVESSPKPVTLASQRG